MNRDNPFVIATLAAWVAFELALRFRDVARGRGGTAHDRGTRALIAVVVGVAVTLTGVISYAARHDSALWLPGQGTDALLAAGVAIMWLGLALRAWAVATLGAAFRTTVEVDADQQLVDRGPYRVLRHPSYTGVLLITTGYGVLSASWPSLLLAIAAPAAVLARRIAVEERALEETMGDSYRGYRARTKRLVPGIW